MTPGPPPADGGLSTRTRAVARPVDDAPPTTAELIRRTDASVDRLTYAALGVALHHFTDVLEASADPLIVHRATTVLTKQVRLVLEDADDALDVIRRLVTDPDREALPDGRSAAEVCGDAWDDVRAVAEQRATASCDGAVEFGNEAIINLAAVRGVGAIDPWWGTPMWRQRVDAIPERALSPDDRDRLLDAPEGADDVALATAVLGSRAARQVAMAAEPAGSPAPVVSPEPEPTRAVLTG